MPVPLIRCRNKVTGAEGELPETALPHMTDWARLDHPAVHTDEGATDDMGSQDAPPVDEPTGASTRRTAKSKPANPATETKE